MGDMKAQVETIAKDSNAVAVQDASSEEAYADEQLVEVELLEQVLRMVQPAIGALSSRVKSSYRVTHLADVDRQREVETIFSWQGIRVWGNGAMEDQPRDTSGEYDGKALYLTAACTWVAVQYVGRWTRYQGGTCWWRATSVGTSIDEKNEEDVAITWGELTTEQVVESYSVGRILSSISTALVKQLEGNASKRTKAAQDRAAKIRAVLELIK